MSVSPCYEIFKLLSWSNSFVTILLFHRTKLSTALLIRKTSNLHSSLFLLPGYQSLGISFSSTLWQFPSFNSYPSPSLLLHFSPFTESTTSLFLLPFAMDNELDRSNPNRQGPDDDADTPVRNLSSHRSLKNQKPAQFSV